MKKKLIAISSLAVLFGLSLASCADTNTPTGSAGPETQESEPEKVITPGEIKIDGVDFNLNKEAQLLSFDVEYNSYSFDLNNVKMEGFTSEAYDLDGKRLNGLVPLGYGNNSFIIHFKAGKVATTYTLNIFREAKEEAAVKEITLNRYFPARFNPNDKFNTGLVDVAYTDGRIVSEEVSLDNLRGFSTASVGKHTAKVSYKGYELDYSYEVLEDVALSNKAAGSVALYGLSIMGVKDYPTKDFTKFIRENYKNAEAQAETFGGIVKMIIPNLNLSQAELLKDVLANDFLNAADIVLNHYNKGYRDAELAISLLKDLTKEEAEVFKNGLLKLANALTTEQILGALNNPMLSGMINQNNDRVEFYNPLTNKMQSVSVSTIENALKNVVGYNANNNYASTHVITDELIESGLSNVKAIANTVANFDNASLLTITNCLKYMPVLNGKADIQDASQAQIDKALLDAIQEGLALISDLYKNTDELSSPLAFLRNIVNLELHGDNTASFELLNEIDRVIDFAEKALPHADLLLDLLKGFNSDDIQTLITMITSATDPDIDTDEDIQLDVLSNAIELARRLRPLFYALKADEDLLELSNMAFSLNGIRFVDLEEMIDLALKYMDLTAKDLTKDKLHEIADAFEALITIDELPEITRTDTLLIEASEATLDNLLAKLSNVFITVDGEKVCVNTLKVINKEEAIEYLSMEGRGVITFEYKGFTFEVSFLVYNKADLKVLAPNVSDVDFTPTIIVDGEGNITTVAVGFNEFMTLEQYLTHLDYRIYIEGYGHYQKKNFTADATATLLRNSKENIKMLNYGGLKVVDGDYTVVLPVKYHVLADANTPTGYYVDGLSNNAVMVSADPVELKLIIVYEYGKRTEERVFTIDASKAGNVAYEFEVNGVKYKQNISVKTSLDMALPFGLGRFADVDGLTIYDKSKDITERAELMTATFSFTTYGGEEMNLTKSELEAYLSELYAKEGKELTFTYTLSAYTKNDDSQITVKLFDKNDNSEKPKPIKQISFKGLIEGVE